MAGLVAAATFGAVVLVCSQTVTAQQQSNNQTTTVFLRAPHTNADPRAKLVQDLRKYFREHPKERVRIVDDEKQAQFVVDVNRPDVTGSVIPYIASGAGDDRITANDVYVAAARVCMSDSDNCQEFTASAKLRTMATLQLAEQIAKHVAAPAR